MSKKKIKQIENVADLVKNNLADIGKKKVNACSNIHSARQWRIISSKAKLKVVTVVEKFLTVKHNMEVGRYKEINDIEEIREFWTKKIKKEETIKEIDDEQILRSMSALMKGELDRYIHYSKLEAINPKRTSPSPDVTKVAQNIFYYFKDILKIIKGEPDLPPGFGNPRAFMLAETLNIFQNLKSNDKKQFVDIIDETIKGKSEPTKTE